MPDLKNPLTDEDLIAMNENVERLNEARGLLQKMKQAGEDTAEAEAELTRLQTRISRYKTAFFPGQ